MKLSFPTQVLPLLSLVLLLPASSAAQIPPVTGTVVNVYRPSNPVSVIAPQTIPLSSYTCNQASQPPSQTVNPGGFSFADPNNPGRFCNYTAPANGVFSLLAFDIAPYEFAIAPVNSVGVGPEARLPFTRPGNPPAALAQVRLTSGT